MDAGEIFLWVTIIGALLWAISRGPKIGPAPMMVCTTCGHHGKTKRMPKGSTGVELVLWLAFILPGLIYSLWRVSSKRQVCATCGSEQVVSETSPVGKRLLQS